MVNPIDNPEAYDVCRIGGVQTNVSVHGLVEIYDPAFQIKWDHWIGYGLANPTSRPVGTEVIQFGARFSFTEGFQIENFYRDVGPLLTLPKSTQGGGAVQVLNWFHPLTARPPVVVHSVGIKEVSTLKRTDDTGGWCVELKLFGYTKAKPIPAKPLVETADPKPTPQDEADLLILQLSDQAKAMVKR